jgi:hypothetical protein
MNNHIECIGCRELMDKLACLEDELRKYRPYKPFPDVEYERLKSEAKERDAKILQLILERERYKTQADQRYGLRKELEDLLGFKDGETYDHHKFAECVERIKGMKGELEEARSFMAIMMDRIERGMAPITDSHMVESARKFLERK